MDSIFHPGLLPAVMGSLIFVIVGSILLAVVWRVIDWITPGKLNDELVPPQPAYSVGHKQPNIALAIVVGCFVLGFAHIIAMSIH